MDSQTGLKMVEQLREHLTVGRESVKDHLKPGHKEPFYAVAVIELYLKLYGVLCDWIERFGEEYIMRRAGVTYVTPALLKCRLPGCRRMLRPSFRAGRGASLFLGNCVDRAALYGIFRVGLVRGVGLGDNLGYAVLHLKDALGDSGAQAAADAGVFVYLDFHGTCSPFLRSVDK